MTTKPKLIPAVARLEAHLDEADYAVAMPVRLVYSQAAGYGIELGPQRPAGVVAGRVNLPARPGRPRKASA